MTAQDYFKRDPERETFYRIFYQMCRRFNVVWSSASPEVKAFIEEATRSEYRKQSGRSS